MPEAESFNALGRGNGFMSCLDKVDASTYQLWTTFSGWSKDDTPVDDTAKSASIEESRRLAMLWFWNSYELDITNTGDANEVLMNADYCTDFPDCEPKDRVCNPDVSAENSANDNSYAEFIPDEIVRMYDGNTSDEANFVGFGFKGLGSGSNWAALVYDADQNSVELRGYSSRFAANTAHAYASLPISGTSDSLDCVCHAEEFFNDEELLDPANMRVIGACSIVSVELYTYPT